MQDWYLLIKLTARDLSGYFWTPKSHVRYNWVSVFLGEVWLYCSLNKRCSLMMLYSAPKAENTAVQNNDLYVTSLLK